MRFKPDWQRFKLIGITDDFVRLMYKRCLDVAATLGDGVSVYFSDKLVEVTRLTDSKPTDNNERPTIFFR